MKRPAAQMPAETIVTKDGVPLPGVRGKLQFTVAEVAPFALSIAGGGAFPPRRRPRVLWAGVAGDLDALRRLADRVDAVCAELGYDDERLPFSPHVTLGRVAGAVDRQRVRALSELPDLGPWPVDSVHVMQSLLGEGPARYASVARLPLSG